jgi:hypothetical protein
MRSLVEWLARRFELSKSLLDMRLHSAATRSSTGIHSSTTN